MENISTATLLELAVKWEREAIIEGARDGSPDAAVKNAIEDGESKAKNYCADQLRRLIELLT